MGACILGYLLGRPMFRRIFGADGDNEFYGAPLFLVLSFWVGAYEITQLSDATWLDYSMAVTKTIVEVMLVFGFLTAAVFLTVPRHARRGRTRRNTR